MDAEYIRVGDKVYGYDECVKKSVAEAYLGCNAKTIEKRVRSGLIRSCLKTGTTQQSMVRFHVGTLVEDRKRMFNVHNPEINI